MPIELGATPEAFIWATGIEDTFVPQTRAGHRALDEYELIGHYEHWREDLALAGQVGAQALRWGVPWYRVEPLPGEFDWSWTDEVIPYLVEELGITPIVDLMHYGCPFWLRREFASTEYPRAVASYAAAFARRYRHLVRWYTPLNEPLINSLMCGRRGIWPPYLRGDRGYARVSLQLAKGIVETVRAIQEVDPSAIMVHVEATGLSRAASHELESLAEESRLLGFLNYDLVTGRIVPGHPLFHWLLRNGALPNELENIARNPIGLDVLGLNFYPQWSTHEYYVHPEGKIARRAVEKDGSGFAEMVESFYRRYEAPVIITETSARGAESIRSRWLAESVESVKALRSRGIPVHGYTWFPFFTMIDWRYRLGRAPVEKYRLELGLFKLGDGAQRWQATPLVEQFRHYVNDPAGAIGSLAVPDTQALVS
jgi:beta-glucosidase/6-phospho-beta-glucosidase/beta-galactosidase